MRTGSILAVVLVVSVIAGLGAAYTSGIFDSLANIQRSIGSTASEETAAASPAAQPTTITTDSGIKVSSSETSTLYEPTGHKILDKETFVLPPRSSKSFDFSIDHPHYPIKVTGDMVVTDHKKKVTFALTSDMSPIQHATMETSPNYVKAAIGIFVVGKNQPYMMIDGVWVDKEAKENPEFHALFVNESDIEQTVTANLTFTY